MDNNIKKDIPKKSLYCNKCSFDNVEQHEYDYIFNCCQRILENEDICAFKIYKRKNNNKFEQSKSKKTNTTLNYYRNKLNI